MQSSSCSTTIPKACDGTSKQTGPVYTTPDVPPAQFHIDERENFTVYQMFTPCLAHMAYVIISGNEGAIIDPLRELEPYLELLKDKGAKLKYIFETHFHADFVSGHYDLAQKTGAKIVFGPTAKPNFEAYIAKDDETLKVGDIGVKVLHTPGHTMESSCFLLMDGDKQQCLFTGDTLFLGEVGRPDLATKSNEITKEDLASLLYDSLRNKVMKLDHQITIYPGHGAGSPCGKNIGAGTHCTLGNQLKKNYALQDMDRKTFVSMTTLDLPTPP